MKIAVLSDTHGSHQYIDMMVNRLIDRQPDLVIHLGDDYDDAKAVTDAGFKLEQVPGTWTHYYKNPAIENRKYLELNGWTFFLTHTPTIHFNDLPFDIDPEEVVQNQQADVLMHGHTHHPEIDTSQEVVIFNPGHLKIGDNRGYPPSYGWLSVDESTLRLEIYTLLDNQLLKDANVTK